MNNLDAKIPCNNCGDTRDSEHIITKSLNLDWRYQGRARAEYKFCRDKEGCIAASDLWWGQTKKQIKLREAKK